MRRYPMIEKKRITAMKRCPLMQPVGGIVSWSASGTTTSTTVVLSAAIVRATAIPAPSDDGDDCDC